MEATALGLELRHGKKREYEWTGLHWLVRTSGIKLFCWLQFLVGNEGTKVNIEATA